MTIISQKEWVALLMQGVTPFNDFRNNWRTKAINIMQMDFSGDNLSNVDFREANFRNVDFNGVNFYRANFNSATFREGNFRDADLREADLSAVHFYNSDLTGADLRGADLSFTSFVGKCTLNKIKISKEQKANFMTAMGISIY